MTVVGYLIALAAIYLLYDGALFIGMPLFFVGGFLAGQLKIRISSLGIMMMVGGGAYGFHNEFTPAVIITIILGFFLSGLWRGRNDWGIDLGDLFDSDGDSGGGDGSGGGGD